jgi:N-acetylglutamate synthase-like GNAT family acetyltransferase
MFRNKGGVMINIRRITQNDAPHVKALIENIMHKEFLSSKTAYATNDIEDPVKYYGGERDIFLVAEEDGKIIGTVAIKEDTPHTALLRRFFVSPEYRKRGYGKQLIRQAMDFCFNHNYQNVIFRGTDKMQSALKVCLMEGFKEHDVLAGTDFKMFVLEKALSANSQKKSYQLQ